MPKKTQRMVYAKGKSVFELIDPDGHIYVLQAHDAQFPIESLAKLGEQMKQLPKGWQYRTRALTEDLVLDLGPDKTIYAVGDEFHQYYTRIAETKTQISLLGTERWQIVLPMRVFEAISLAIWTWAGPFDQLADAQQNV